MQKCFALAAALALSAAVLLTRGDTAPSAAARLQTMDAPDTSISRRFVQLTPPPPDLKPVRITPRVIYNRAGRPVAPLRVETPAGENYVIKLVQAANGKEAMMLYVTGGKPFQTEAPLGSYKTRGASGSTWYGEKNLFGPDTRYFKLQSKGRSGAESEEFKFYRAGNQVHGFRITLIKQADGNLETEPIKPDEF